MPEKPQSDVLKRVSTEAGDRTRKRPHGTVRGMTRDDVPAIGRLFLKAFRHRKDDASPAFARYFSELFFDCPTHDPAFGGVVHVDETGYLDSAIASIPMPLMACGRVITARLMCAFMSDPESRSDGAVRLALTSRPKLQDFAFSDTASETSAGFTSAVGGCVLPIQSQEWRYVFRPLTHLVRSAQRRWARLSHFGLSVPARMADRVVGAVTNRKALLPKTTANVVPMSDDDFIARAPQLIAHFAVRPVWAPKELRWLLTMARQNVKLGPLKVMAVHSPAGETIGCLVYFGKPARLAMVLNIFAQPGHEADVVAAMTRHLADAGYSSAFGMAQPYLMAAMEASSGFTFRKRGFYCVSTKHADVRAAIESGDFFTGGLASESWSRLLNDFA